MASKTFVSICVLVLVLNLISTSPAHANWFGKRAPAASSVTDSDCNVFAKSRDLSVSIDYEEYFLSQMCYSSTSCSLSVTKSDNLVSKTTYLVIFSSALANDKNHFQLNLLWQALQEFSRNGKQGVTWALLHPLKSKMMEPPH